MPGRKRRVSKSAGPRLPKPSGLVVSFSKPSEAEWEKLEEAYGRKIPDEARSEIIAATTRMLRESIEEYHARPLSESIKHITRLRKAANNLLAAWTVSGRPLTDSEFSAAVRADPVRLAHARVARANAIARARARVSGSIRFAEEAINQELSKVTDDVTFDGFHDHLLVFVGACDRAPALANSMAVEGGRPQAFDDFIKALRYDICPRYGLPTGAAKDRPLNPSPFVSFAWEFLRMIDAEYLYKPHSCDALATAINEVDRHRTHTRFGRKRARPNKNTSRKRR